MNHKSVLGMCLLYFSVMVFAQTSAQSVNSNAPVKNINQGKLMPLKACLLPSKGSSVTKIADLLSQSEKHLKSGIDASVPCTWQMSKRTDPAVFHWLVLQSLGFDHEPIVGKQKYQAIALLQKAAAQGQSLQDFSINATYLKEIEQWRHSHGMSEAQEPEERMRISMALESMGLADGKSISLWELASGFARDDVLTILKASPNGDYETPAYQMSAAEQKQAQQLSGRYAATSLNRGATMDNLALNPDGSFTISWLDSFELEYKGKWWVENSRVVLKSDPSLTAPAWKIVSKSKSADKPKQQGQKGENLRLKIDPINYYEDYPFKTIVTNAQQQKIKGSAMIRMVEDDAYFAYQLKVSADLDDLYIGFISPEYWRKVPLTGHKADRDLHISPDNQSKIYHSSLTIMRLEQEPDGLQLTLPYMRDSSTIDFKRVAPK